jgi:hypothetical protein
MKRHGCESESSLSQPFAGHASGQANHGIG